MSYLFTCADNRYYAGIFSRTPTIALDLCDKNWTLDTVTKRVTRDDMGPQNPTAALSVIKRRLATYLTDQLPCPFANAKGNQHNIAAQIVIAQLVTD